MMQIGASSEVVRCGVNCSLIYSNSSMRSAEVVLTLQIKWRKVTLIYDDGRALSIRYLAEV